MTSQCSASPHPPLAVPTLSWQIGNTAAVFLSRPSVEVPSEHTFYAGVTQRVVLKGSNFNTDSTQLFFDHPDWISFEFRVRAGRASLTAVYCDVLSIAVNVILTLDAHRHSLFFGGVEAKIGLRSCQQHLACTFRLARRSCPRIVRFGAV